MNRQLHPRGSDFDMVLGSVGRVEGRLGRVTPFANNDMVKTDWHVVLIRGLKV